MKCFNGSNPPKTFLLTDGNGATVKFAPGTFADIPDAFSGDMTFRMAVAAREIQCYETVKEGGQLEKAAEKKKAQAASSALKKAKAEDAKQAGALLDAVEETLKRG